MEGVIVGGQEYIVAAYVIVWGGMLAYGVRLFLQLRKAERAESSTKENQ